jgi:hypothetical protein
MTDYPNQAAQKPDPYKGKYEELFAACGKANGVRQALLIKISKQIGALSKIICEPDPPGCDGEAPAKDLDGLVRDMQKANVAKKQMLQSIEAELDQLMEKMCDPDPPGCIIQ